MTDLERFEKWSSQFPMSVQFREVAWMAWQAALSTRKAYGYGIVDKDGEYATTLYESELAYKECSYMNSYQDRDKKALHGYPFRVVELFYEDTCWNEHDGLVKERDELKGALREMQAYLWDHVTPEGHQLWHKIKAILAKS